MRGEPAFGGLQADDVIKACRNATGPGGVGAQRKRHQPARHHRGRAGTGAAADVITVKSVHHCAIRRAGADQPGGELIEVGFANHNRASGFQAGDDGGVGVGVKGKIRTGGGGREARDINIVLHRKGDAEQRQRGGVLLIARQQFSKLPVDLDRRGPRDPGVVLFRQCRQMRDQKSGNVIDMLLDLLLPRAERLACHDCHFLPSQLVYKMECMEQKPCQMQKRRFNGAGGK